MTPKLPPFVDGSTDASVFEAQRRRDPWDPPPATVYIGRSGPWGNPYRIASGIARVDSLRLYEAYVRGEPALMTALEGLAGKRLVCPGHCAPKPCHGDVLVRLWKEKFA